MWQSGTVRERRADGAQCAEGARTAGTASGRRGRRADGPWTACERRDNRCGERSGERNDERSGDGKGNVTV
ncbi:hypothetical protein DEO72_LG5g73 [Vigna unguiculata]|uniref:Uncharacterized protein n=1 Tax=Vigna unguiculata TaxID=3917 RepID=A0A4D6LVI6_VIGUN|nr:hypothetical protein DEO72_LG5g73 [Vigna unguiculata]